MTSPPGPPSYPPRGSPPPYGPPPYGPPPGVGPPRRSSGATVVTALLAVLFVAATAVAAWAVHDRDSGSAAASAALGRSGAPLPGAAASYSAPAPVTPTITPAPTTSSYVPPAPAPTPTHQPLNAEAVNRTFQVYMNALLYRSLSQLKSATCPKLRHTETGTALDHKYINRWQGHDYTIYNDLDYVIIAATVRYVNPNTGGNGKTHVYRWYVDRYPDGHYWVCGIL